MAHISGFGFLQHLRAQPNEYILQFSGGRLRREGVGLSFWFNPLSASIAQVPVEDRETTFVLNERTSDLQEANVQITLNYRVENPSVAAKRINFSIAMSTGSWSDRPFERIATFWAQRCQGPARAYLISVGIEEAIRSGGQSIQERLIEALAGDKEIGAMGLAVVSIQVIKVSPTAEMDKALQTPTREGIQQKADEATFQRRALAVEKERAIKQNEMETQVDLARREETLVRQNGANRLLEAQQTAETKRTEAEAQAGSISVIEEARTSAEAKRLELYGGASPQAAMAITMQEFARHLKSIQHLNITPDMLSSSFSQFLRDQGDAEMRGPNADQNPPTA